MKFRRWLLILFLFLNLPGFSNLSHAAFKLVEGGPIRGGGIVKDSGSVGTSVFVRWTDKDGSKIGETPKQEIGNEGFVEFVAPKEIVDSNGTPHVVTDFRQFASPANAGEVSVLDVVALEPMGSDFLVTPFPDFIRTNLGLNVELRVPDLYGDTDGNGILGVGDVLYSAVNLVNYFPALPAYQLGDNFSIVNGVSPLLPGFLFGTEPILRDANSPTGFVNPSPFSGTGLVLTEHLVSTIPEPSTLLMFPVGILGLFGYLYCIRKRLHDGKNRSYQSF